MSANDPGLDLHEWETRWAELEESLAEDAAGSLAEACDLVEQTLDLGAVDADLANSYRAARETADAVERGEDVDPGDLGAAVENLQLLRAVLRPGSTE